MAGRAALSSRSAGVRRLLREAAELQADECTDYDAAPTEDDLFEWHFTIKGPGGDYEGGRYHGRLVLPAEYPFKPPEVYMMTPSGRFETNKKICLSISSFHPESWQPSWGIRTALVALMAFFSSDPQGAVGSLDTSPEERRRLATLSRQFKCRGCNYDASVPIVSVPSTTIDSTTEAVVSTSEVAQMERSSEQPPSTTIFPSSSPNAPSTTIPSPMTNAPPPMPVLQHRALEANPPAPNLPAQPVIEVMMGAEGFSTEGGQPLVVDRVILCCLILLVALIIRKIA